METMKYSVIIPVYKAENTLRRCVDSLLFQPHEKAEILLVDDGSPDESGSICREYERQNACIRYLRKENGGVSSARNLGIDHARGRYLLFVDSDDYVTEDYFSSIDAALAEYDYDLIQFSNFFTDGTRQIDRIREPFRGTTRDALFGKLIESLCEKKSNAPYAKVFSRDLVNAHMIRFPEDMELGEDRAFFVHYSLYMNSFAVSDHPIYYVNTENEFSLSRKLRNDLDEQNAHLNAYLDECIQRSETSPEEQIEYKKALNYDTLRMVYSKAKMLRRENTSLSQRLKTLHACCRNLNSMNLAYPDTRYCRITSLPVRWDLALLIDLMAWKLNR